MTVWRERPHRRGVFFALPLRSISARLAVAITIALSFAACAGNECRFHSQCGERSYCHKGRCLQACQRDVDCDFGQQCNEIGMCVASQTPREDASVSMPDAFVPPPSDGGAPVEMDAGADLDAGVDAGADAGMDAGTDAGSHPETDAGSDSGMDAGMDAGLDAGADAGLDAGVDAGVDAGPPPFSTYSYRRIPVGGLREAIAVAFHPDGSYAIVLERTEAVHVYDRASETATRIPLSTGGRTLTLDDLEFAEDGSVAWIVGSERTGSTDTGVVIEFDDARWRTGDGAGAFSRWSVSAAGERFTGIVRPRAPSGGPGEGRPIVLSQSGSSPYIARLRELDPDAGTLSTPFAARATSAGCDDLAFVDNEFGGFGIVLACGTNGADAPYYTSIAGVGEWRAGPVSLGNVSRAAGHPSGAYALIVNWSSQYLHRVEGGAFRPTSTSPALAHGIFDVSFSPDGRLALIVGRAGGSPLRGQVFEFRHDEWSRAEIHDVSIEGFGGPPYSATSNTRLNDSAFRPGCDAGLIVGGHSSHQGSTGYLIEFSRDLSPPCH